MTDPVEARRGGEPFSEEERLRREYAEIAMLAGGLAHEIRNPLSTISLNLDLLAEDLDDESAKSRRALQKIETIQGECAHLEAILNAFLQFARVDELEPEAADLNEIVAAFVEFYRPQADEHRIEISPHLGSDLPRVRVDQALFRQVLMNLARNAQDAMPDGGTIELQTRCDGDAVILEFIDSGSGMDAETREKIFRVFYSRKPGGSGLGLPTVRKIVEAHGGTIRCDSEPGRGTRMAIRLPAAAE